MKNKILNHKCKYLYTNKKGESFVSHREFPKYRFGTKGTVLSEKTGKIIKLKGRKKGKYLAVVVNKKDWYIHQLIYYIFKDKKATRENPVTHNNKITTDNSLENLNQITQRENQSRRINKTGLTGVEPNGKLFKTQYVLQGKRWYLGSYLTKQIASIRYKLALETDQYYKAKNKWNPIGLIKYYTLIIINAKKHQKSKLTRIIEFKNYVKTIYKKVA